ncbi:MAG: SDR family oxidoreductase, partial [Propionibacteriaceae bacterium]
LLTARAASRHMTAQGRGVIMTFTADAARLALPEVGSFGIACAAVEGLTRSLAAELGPYGIARAPIFNSQTNALRPRVPAQLIA